MRIDFDSTTESAAIDTWRRRDGGSATAIVFSVKILERVRSRSKPVGRRKRSKPNQSPNLPTLGEILQRARQSLASGRLAEAEPIYRQLAAAAPRVPEVWHELGLVLLHMGRLDEATHCLERATQLSPANADFQSNLGAAYRQQNRPDAAAECFRRALEIGPATAALHNNLALALKDLQQFDAALPEFDQALALQSDFANGHFNRANLLLALGRLDEAIAGYRRALELQPDDSGAWCKLGIAHYDKSELDPALACFDRALALAPDYPEARRNRALVWLSQGDYARGWPEWESRLLCQDIARPPAVAPQWRGEPLVGRTILLHDEQGLGDTLQFVRYVPLVERLGGQVRLQVKQALVPLLRESGYDHWLVAPGQRLAADYQCSLLSLPAMLLKEYARPYWGGSYLAADLERAAAWRPRIRSSDALQVGIAWAGNPDHPHDRFRSVQLEAFAPLAAVPGVRLVSLQKGKASEQLAASGLPFNVERLSGDWDAGGAFLDTAAIMRNLDLVISVDTSIVHLAGGLGVPCWVALQFAADWRWTLTGSETPWYPSIRLFRQRALHDWNSVFARLADELSKLAAERRG